MIKYNNAFQKKIEDLYDEGGYIVRYEKGSFNSGFCILEKKRVVVINKFHTLDAKINSLIEILNYVDLETETMSESAKKFLQELKEATVPTLL
jgi:hypothetical protein